MNFLRRQLFLLLCILGLSQIAVSQINYTQGFDGCNVDPCNNWDWDIASGNITAVSTLGYSPCAVANPAARANLSGTVLSGTFSSTVSLGTSSGEYANLGFAYKVINVTTGTATAANSCTFTVQWANAAAGPWNTIETFQNISSTACVPYISTRFFPTAGQPIFARIMMTRSTGDFWVVIDDITLTQPPPSQILATDCSCNNDQSPNLTNGTYNTALRINYNPAQPMAPGLVYTLRSSTGLNNISGGPIGMPTFTFCSGGCPPGIMNGEYYLPVQVQPGGAYSANVDGPDPDATADLTLNTNCTTLYPALPVISLADLNCLNAGINTFSSDMAVYSINNSLTNPMLYEGFSQMGSGNLIIESDSINETENDPTMELYLIKQVAGCRVSSYKEFKVFRPAVPTLNNTVISCRATRANDTLFLSTMLDSTNTGGGRYFIGGNEIIDGKFGISGPVCTMVTYSITDSCGVTRSDTKTLQVTLKPAPSFDFAAGSPVSPVCSRDNLTLNLVRTSTGSNPSYTVTSNNPSYNGSISGATVTLQAPALGQSVRYTVCLSETNNAQPVCSTLPPQSPCTANICKNYTIYRDRSDCGANALFTSICADDQVDVCPAFPNPGINVGCSFFNISTPDVLESSVSFDENIYNCDDENITGSYSVSFIGLDAGTGSGGPTLGSLPGLNVVCRILNFKVLGWRPLGALYNILGCGKSLLQAIFDFIATIAGGTGGGYIVMADTDGDGGFDYIIDNKGGDDSVFPGTGTFSIPNKVKGNGFVTVRAVSGWVNKPSSMCGNFDIEPLNILDRFPIGAIPIVGAVVEAILNAGNCGIDVALSQESTESVKVINNSEPDFINCNPSGFTFAQTLDCTIPVNWSVPSAVDGCSELPLIYRGPATGADITNYVGSTPPTVVNIDSPGIYQTAGPVPGSSLEPGVYPISYTAVSCNGNPSICSFNVVVTSGNPILECPNDLTVSTNQDVCSRVINGLAPYQGLGCASIINYSFTSPVTNTVFETNSTTIGTHNIPDGIAFELGVTNITYNMLVDINGDGDYADPGEDQSCNFSITIEDNQTPDAVCLDVDLQLDNLGAGTVFASEMANQIYLDGGSTDNCSITEIVISKDNVNFTPSLNFDCAEIGQNVVILRVTDGSGNISYCKAVVTVVDFFEGFKLDLDVPEVCFEPFQNTYDFSNYIVIARPNGINVAHDDVSTLGPEIVGSFGISAFLPDQGSTNDPGTMTTDGVYTLGTGTGWITISYILSINEQVNQIADTSLLTGCFRMVHDVFRVEKLDPVWNGGFMCCDQLPVWLGGAAWDGTGAPPIPAGMISLTAIRGSYPGDVYGEWTGEGVTFQNPDGVLFSGDEFFQFDPEGLDGTYTLTYIVGDEPCAFTYAQDIRVTCQDLHVELSDITVCPANWVDERVVLTNLDDKDVVVSVTGLDALGMDGAHYGNFTDLVEDLDSVPVVDGRIVIPGFYAPAERDKDYVICVTTFQTTPFGCSDNFCYTITVQDLEAPDFLNCPKEPIVVDAPAGWCNSFVNFEYPEAFDNCMGLYARIEQVDTTGLVSGDLFPVGLTVLSYMAIDTVGNQSYCELKIIVNDYRLAPVITCPSSVEKANDVDMCGAVVNNIAPTMVNDNCINNTSVLYEIKDAAGLPIACGFEDASGEKFPVGTSSVTYTAYDQPLVLITEIVQDGVVSGMEITNFGPAEVDITCAKFVLKDAAGIVLETFTLPINNNISTMFDLPIYPPVDPILWNVRNPDNILEVGETFTHVFNGDQDGDGDVDVINTYARCDVRKYCLMFLERTIDEATINDLVDGEVILRKNECDHDVQTDFIPATPCDPGSFGMLNPGLTTMTPNGASVGLQNFAPSKTTCSFTVKINDLEAPSCIWHDTIPMITTAFPLSTPLNIVADQCLKAMVTMPAGIVDDVNIRNLRLNIANAGAITAYLRSPLGTRIKLFSRVCATDIDACDGTGIAGSPNVNVNLDETIKWTPAQSIRNAVCSPSLGAGGTYRPEESFKAFYGEQGGGVWTLEVFTDEGITGTLTDWDLQILYRLPFSQPDVVLENALDRCDQEYSWIHPILEDNCCVGTVNVTYTFENDVTGVNTTVTEVIKNENGAINVQGCRITRIFEVGKTTIEYALTDQYGNLNTCSFMVTVNDTEKPEFLSPFCPDRTLYLAPTECYGILINPPTAEDNCAVDSIAFCFANGTMANIDALPIGSYNLIAKAVDIYGNIQTCTFSVSVLEFIPTNNSLSCNNEINLSLDATCMAVITPDMILEGDSYRCYENYCIEIKDIYGIPHANLFTIADEGKRFEVSVVDCNGSLANSCWGYVNIEQKLLPLFSCPADLTLACNIDVEAKNLQGKLLTGEGLLESCEVGAEISYQDEWINYGQCNDPRALVERTWTIVDTDGNKVECVQNITIRPLNLDDVVFPADIDFADALDCEDVTKDATLTEPEFTGYPTLNGIKVNQSGSLCMVSLNYSDDYYEICDGSFEILRTWRVRNMCLPVSPTNPRTHIQVIKVLDVDGPIIKDCPTDITLSVNPWTCRAFGPVPLPTTIEELCSPRYDAKAIIYGGGKITISKSPTNVLSANVSDLSIGNYQVKYSFVDECGNKSTCIYNIKVVDNIAPVPVTLQNIVVSLSPGYDANGVADGQAKLFIASVNNGSFDNCTPIRMELRRTNKALDKFNGVALPDAPSCGNIGIDNHNNNITFNNLIPASSTMPYNVKDNDGGEFVKFCCEDVVTPGADVDGNGTLDTGYHMVILRVWDDGNRDGTVGNVGDNFNDSWVNVKVEFKAAPVITCPADATIYCDWAIPTNPQNGTPGSINNAAISVSGVEFVKTGLPSAYGVCTNPDIKFWDRVATDQCGIGNIQRTFQITESGQTRTCVQQIAVQASLLAQVWTFTDTRYERTFVPSTVINPLSVNRGLDVTQAASCEGPSETQIKDWTPRYIYAPCDLIGVSVTPSRFDFEEGVCRKWKIEYSFVNWCDNKQVKFAKYFVYNDTEAPVMACEDKTIPAGAACRTTVALKKSATDDGGCIPDDPDRWLKWQVLVDEWGDGTVDYAYSSFVPSSSTNFQSVVNNIPTKYLAPTKPGVDAEIVFRNVIEGKQSTHKVTWKVTDGCHNFATCEEIIQVRDLKAPTPYCISLSTALMEVPANAPAGALPMIALKAKDFNKDSYDGDFNTPCTPKQDLLFTFDNWAPRVTDTIINGTLVNINVSHYFDGNGKPYLLTNPNATAKYLAGEYQKWYPSEKTSDKIWTSAALNGQSFVDVSIQMTVWDMFFNHDHCATSVKLICNGAGCPQSSGFVVAGTVATTQDQTVNDVAVTMEAVDFPELTKGLYTAQDGKFEFNNGIPGLNYALSASKNGDYLNGVNTLDLVLIQRHILGIEPFNDPYKMIAADANNDGKVSAADLVELRKLILGVVAGLSKNASWRFPVDNQNLSANYPFPFVEKIDLPNIGSDKMDQNFVAVKIGDVSGSASTDLTSPMVTSRSATALKLTYADQKAQKGLVNIPITSSNFVSVFGCQMTLELSNATFVSIKSGAIKVAENNIGVIQNDKITISIASETAITLSEDEVLFTIVVNATSDADVRDLVAITSDVTPAEAYFGSDYTTSKVVLMPRSSIQEDITLYQNVPNPFKGQTTVSFYMPNAADVVLNLHDLTGRLMTSKSITALKGMNEVLFTKDQLVPSGVMYYTLTCGDYTATKKMIIIE
ncbi:MAG TPA: HYR domain-containing protein [Saprospiraceae bacterium]|nr:HYR domain-containing protein [Saprospiraceae bacterium]